jgi:iron complex transport system substrate-binding protein
MNRRLGGWRRALTVAAAGLLAAATLTACASDKDSAAAPAASGSAGTAFPVSIAHKFGSTTIDKRPERVVTVGWNDQDPVLALGVVPVSTREWFTEYPTYPWVKQAVGG